jgi:uncharacterized protein YcbX
MAQKVGVIAEIWRYPVKSMRGEQLIEARLTQTGIDGDRGWALLDVQSMRALSAKKWPDLLELRAAFVSPGFVGREQGEKVVVTMPDGRVLAVAEPAASEVLSDYLGHAVRFAQPIPEQRVQAEIDPATVFGDVPASMMRSSFVNPSAPDTFTLIKGGFHDAAPLHLLTNATLEFLRSRCEADAKIDVRRFRPNFLLATVDELGGLCEDRWQGHVLKIGQHAQIEVVWPTVRCVMTTHQQSDLPRDLRVLRAVAQENAGNLGVFAKVRQSGMVRVGDEVLLCA